MARQSFEDRMAQSEASHQCRTLFEWDMWMERIPAIQFPAYWKIRIIPPFACAIVRFVVIDHNGSSVSVFLDGYQQLGSTEQPYWEIHPSDNGDVTRILMDDVDELLDEINKGLIYQNPTPYTPDIIDAKDLPPDVGNRFAAVDLVMEHDE